MYRYTEFDRQFLRQRAAQYRDQLDRHLRGELADEDFRPLRLQNGWYLQRHAPMLRVAIPYGELSSRQLRQLAHIAREHDRQDAGRPAERGGFGHFTTRQNLQFNWIPLTHSADVMDLLAEVDMHGIQTSGNCIRNITTDALAGIAPDETVDPRPYAELLRQWSTLHPEFAFLPRKFKIAITGAAEDRAATDWHDIGLTLRRNARGEVGFRVAVGGGMGRTPLVATEFQAWVPWQQILVYLEAVVRAYNLYGRRDNQYKSRIKILVKAEGQAFVETVQREFAALLSDPGTPLLQAGELARVSAGFALPPPAPEPGAAAAAAEPHPPSAAGSSATCMRTACPAIAR
jgi:sulfite reductase (NADPH) hemoprotein beta-component